MIGQTIPHSHIHIIPQTKEGIINVHDSERKIDILNFFVKSVIVREVRSETDMAEEANRLRDHFEQSTYIQ